MKTIKLNALALASALTVSLVIAPMSASATGIPVVDLAGLAQAISQYQQLVAQLENMQSQLKQAKDQYASMTGTRGMENLLKGENRNVIPTNWQETLAQMNGGQISGLAQSIKANARKVDTATLDQLTPELRSMTEQLANTAASQQASAGETYDNASQRFTRLQGLMDAIPQAQDMKAIADLQARIQVEQTMLQNESIKLQALAQASAAQRQIEARQGAEMGLYKSVPVEFGPVVNGGAQ
ncbi:MULTISPECIES: P-type DNA transfer protein VirB5 [Xanthomonas]|uniref:P-type DNA transfer protein VirB5 n=1 Tax=Xanthomonas TaxID=338 RepID=UPI00115DBBAB|nr:MULTISPECIES: P-type DNA transfer protein VirB5 [Xanthomonas]MBZ2574371.1 P-type DNA transfer protein VirB5 [Xanthomonas perforans]MBZ3027339.1 P-type DNA transfer protein VirB5 [Xanthomonas perforans]MBZ3036025.1 P-type DNA transfer protein VirB5 [Xanthomonas perforans]MBZ3048165.1 P-type DNA transfer protein VirB5 [Xanthomonas perforans]MCC3256338.1 P-type DNA transfer protein VirB5 [Xanthomonas campestris pv. armoraciae]